MFTLNDLRHLSEVNLALLVNMFKNVTYRVSGNAISFRSYNLSKNTHSCSGAPQHLRPLASIDAEASWNVMAHAQKPDLVFRRNGRVHLNRWGRQFIRLLAAEVWASAIVMVVMLDIPCSEVVWKGLATHSIRQFPLHFPLRASPCAITFQPDFTSIWPNKTSLPLAFVRRWIRPNATYFCNGEHRSDHWDAFQCR